VITDLNVIVKEWAYRVHDGKPDPNNSAHIYHLSEILIEYKWPFEVIDEILQNLNEIAPTTLVANPNPKGKKEKVQYQYARQWLDDNPGADVSDEYEDEVGDEKPEKKVKKKIKYGEQGKVIKDGEVTRDKTLRKVSSKTEKQVFSSDIEPDDNIFDERNQNYNVTKKKKKDISNPPPPYKLPSKLLKTVPKVPKKYLQMIERMVNTQRVNDFNPPISHFTDEKGAGRISAQAGEIMTLAVAGMTDDQVELFQESLNKHLDDPNRPKKQVIDKSWVEAAVNNRKAMYKRLKNEYPDINLPDDIVHSVWDTKTDVEAMGLSDYEKNKGFSSDMYLSINTPKGVMLDEVSLKKDRNVNFLNSGAGSFKEWDPDLPDNINQNVYVKKMRTRNEKFFKKNLSKINKLLTDKPISKSGQALRNLMDSKGITNLEDAIPITSRDTGNVVWTAVHALAGRPKTKFPDSPKNPSAITLMEQDTKEHNKFVSDSIDAIMTNKKMYNGMMEEIKAEFPLKAVSTTEESMAIGDMSMDKRTMKSVFGTDDYEKIKDGLVAIPPKPIVKDGEPVLDKNGEPKMSPPYMGYQAKVGDEVVPIAEIKTRQDGRGYGSGFKFEMKLDKRFAKKLKEANNKVYGE